MSATPPAGQNAPPRRVSLVLHPRRDVSDAVATVREWADRSGVMLRALPDARLPESVARCDDGEVAQNCDVLLSLGGDGTLLGAMRAAAPLGVPVLGVNLGRVGYLTEVDGQQLPEALDAPHGLFNRAVVLGDDERLGVEVLPTSAPVALEVDGQLMAEVQPGWSLEVAPNPWPALLVRLGDAGFAERARR